MILASHGIIGSSIVQIDPNAFVFSVKTDNAGVSTSTQFRMPLTTSTGLNFVVNWGDGVTETITNHTLAIHTYASAGTYTISVTGDILGWQFNNSGDRLKILNIFQWKGLNISVGLGFFGCENLTATATDAPLITSISFQNYFRNCSNFNGAIGNWNVSTVTNMFDVFRGATIFNQDIGNWDVQNVTFMSSMFFGASAFNQNIGSWNVGSLQRMDNMFFGALAFNQDIGNWNVSNVVNMGSTFRNASSFNQDIGNWDVSNVTNFTDFMSGKTNLNYSAANLDSIYINWSLLSVQPNITITFGTIKHTASGTAGRLVLTSAPNNWSITDGGI